MYQIVSDFLSKGLKFCMVLFGLIAFAQEAELHKTNVTILGVDGLERAYFFRDKDSSLIQSGKYEFTGFSSNKYANNAVKFDKIQIIGNFLNNQLNGSFLVSYNSLLFEEIIFRETKQTVNLNGTLNGEESLWKLSFANGKLDGQQTLNVTPVRDGRKGNTIPTGKLSFNADTLIGDIFLEKDSVRIVGALNDKGFLDGKFEISFYHNEDFITQTRDYVDGFLLEAKSFKNDNLMIHVIYGDVKEKLQQLKVDTLDLHYKVSDDYCGIQFNTGFLFDSDFIEVQRSGNIVFDSTMQVFFDNVFEFFPNHTDKNPIFKLTRRFEFVYPDDSIATRLKPIVEYNLENISEFVENARLQFVSEKSAKVSEFLTKLKLVQMKMQIIDSVITLVDDGYYKFRQRNNFFRNGIAGLNQEDSVALDEKKGKYYKLPVTNFITSSQDFLLNLELVYGELQRISQTIQGELSKELVVYDNQEVIDSLDLQVKRLSKELDSLFATSAIEEDQMKRTFKDKLYLSIQNEVIAPTKQQYLSQNNSFEESVRLGNELVCVMKKLKINEPYLNRINNFRKYWNDSLFTKYIDNPFDTRKFETNILNNVNNASNTLLTYYGNNLLNSKNCSDLDLWLNKIIRLEKRVSFLTAQYEDDKVLRLDATLRRERVPERIERILEL
ncbi:MAG: hypothetical protein LAT76_02785 [Schleiferiaceae bacterium]|nr:hypothetical protein [Schleiferiaceae bacterium]